MSETCVRVKFKRLKRAVWAVRGAKIGTLRQYTVCDRKGDTRSGREVPIYLATAEEVAWEKPAVMNLHYGELEVASGT